jgi:hypothetical protein
VNLLRRRACSLPCLYVGVQLSENRPPVVAALRLLSRFDEATHTLYVLLRHRPHSISRLGASSGGIPTATESSWCSGRRDTRAGSPSPTSPSPNPPIRLERYSPSCAAFQITDMAPPSHYIEVFKLLDGGLRDGGWMGEGRPTGGHALAILPGLTHYTIGQSPLFAAVTLDFLDEQRT